MLSSIQQKSRTQYIMSKRIFKLKFVPNDEANGARDALDEAGIEFYETPAGYLTAVGLNASGLWVADEDVAAARTVIDDFQKDWLEKMRTDAPFEQSASKSADRFMFSFLLFVAVLAIIILYIINAN